MTILSVPDISCNHCKMIIERALGAVPEADKVTVDLAGKTVEVAGPASSEALIKALDQAGYPASVTR